MSALTSLPTESLKDLGPQEGAINPPCAPYAFWGLERVKARPHVCRPQDRIQSDSITPAHLQRRRELVEPLFLGTSTFPLKSLLG